MVIHELATNSVKYGAFGDSSGTALVHWDIRGHDLHFEWKEQNGPPIQPSQRKGFGSVLIVSIIEADLDGKVEIALEAAGLRCTAVIPIKGVPSTPPQSAAIALATRGA